MVLIVDSGSSKSDWVLLKGREDRQKFETMGFNPVFHSVEAIVVGIGRNKELLAIADQVAQIFYYGAGCSSQGRSAIVNEALTSVFSNAEIQVAHDLLASAYATYSGQPAIACILGTGSNSCHFDGRVLTEGPPALGYILGDEGSGTYFGKKLLATYLYHHLPAELSTALEQQLSLNKEVIINSVYKQPNANVFLASCMPFIAEHRKNSVIRAMLHQGFMSFMQVHVCSYPRHSQEAIHFVGSIAYYFEEEVRQAAKELGLQVGTIMRKPIEGLISYHLDNTALKLDN